MQIIIKSLNINTARQYIKFSLPPKSLFDFKTYENLTRDYQNHSNMKNKKQSPNDGEFLEELLKEIHLPESIVNFYRTIVKNDTDEFGKEYRYIMVGNMIDKHYFGENKEIRSGTKQFRPGAKLYLFPEYGGMGHENIPVYGLARKTKRKIMITIRACMIKNVRVQKTYDLKICNYVQESFFYKGLKLDGNELEDLNQFAASMNLSNIEIE